MAGVNGHRPERGQSGSFLNKASAPGSRVNFVLPSTEGFTSGVIPAGGTLGIASNTIVYDLSVPSANQTSQNVLPWNQAVCWQYYDIYIDNDNDFNYIISTGSSLSADQLLVQIRVQVQHITPVSGRTDTVSFRIYNGGASPHTIYYHRRTKIVITE